MDNMGDSEKIYSSVRNLSVRDGKVLDNVGVRYDRSIELPKLERHGFDPRRPLQTSFPKDWSCSSRSKYSNRFLR